MEMASFIFVGCYRPSGFGYTPFMNGLKRVVGYQLVEIAPLSS